VTNPGGHSSAPFKDNAIYHLADGLSRLGQFSFPFKLSPVTRAFYERMSKVEKGQVAEDMKAILQDPPDQAALDRLYAVSPVHNSTVRTTCVATKVDAGHADNALPQRARHRQLPHPAGRADRRSAGHAAARGGRRQDQDHPRRRGRGWPDAADAASADEGGGRDQQ
jgi:hypothetical protein